jgi:hypothetical protein
MAPVFFFRISCQIFEVGRGNTHSIWENIGGGLSPLSTEQQGQIDWSKYVSFTKFIYPVICLCHFNVLICFFF